MVAGIQMVSGCVVSENLDRARQLIEKAIPRGAELVALSEYFCVIGASNLEKKQMAESFGEESDNGPIQSALAALAKQYGFWLAGGSVPILSNRCDPAGRFFNVQLIFYHTDR